MNNHRTSLWPLTAGTIARRGTEVEDEVRNRMEALAKKYDLKFEEEDNFEMDGTFVVCASAPISYEDAETLISAPEFSPECTDDGACIFRGQTKEQVVQMIRDACE